MGVSEKNALTDFIFNSTASYVIENLRKLNLVQKISTPRLAIAINPHRYKFYYQKDIT